MAATTLKRQGEGNYPEWLRSLPPVSGEEWHKPSLIAPARIPPVAEVLAGKSVLVTGCSGLTGMYCAAKLLRDVPKLAKLIVPVRGGDDLRKFDPTETRNRSSSDVGDAEGRWAQIVKDEAELFQGCDMSKVVVLPIPHITGLLEAIEARKDSLGPIHGIISILGDSGLGGTEETKRKSNADAPFALYDASRTAPAGHPLATVEGWVQCTTIGINERMGEIPADDFVGHPDRKWRVVTERPWPEVVEMTRTIEGRSAGGGQAGYINGKKRLEALLQRASGDAPPGGRQVPCCVVRPGGIIGCSNLPGGLLPGWSNKGNMNMPLANFLFYGQPDAKTPPKIGFLPPPAFLARSILPTIPVDICVNQHIVGLAALMAHPMRNQIGGKTMPVFNSAHDSQLNGFSFWDFLKGMTHFDETKFDYLNKRGLKLLESHARSMKDTPDGQKLQRELKNYKVATGGMTGRPMCDICQVGSVDWLADTMAESDKTGSQGFPVQFTGEPGFEVYDFAKNISLNHDYFWKHVISAGEKKAQTSKM